MGLLSFSYSRHTAPTPLVIPHFTLPGLASRRKHGLTKFVHEKQRWATTDRSSGRTAIEWFCVDVDGCKIVNVSKPPTSRLQPTAISVFPHSYLYASDFNCQPMDWGYDFICPNGEFSIDWAIKSNLTLLNNSKDAPSIFLAVGTLELIQTWLSGVLALTTCIGQTYCREFF